MPKALPDSKLLKNPSACLLVFILLLFPLSMGCGEKRIIKKNPKLQRFFDRTRTWFPEIPKDLQSARFFGANRDNHADIAFLRSAASGPPVLEIWFNKDGENFKKAERGWTGEVGEQVTDFKTGDLNRDGAHEVILVGKFNDGSTGKLLLNNGRGYVYEDPKMVLPELAQGIEKVNPVDLDRDGNLDLFFTGRRVMKNDGSVARHQIQFFLNRGGGQLTDRTKLLIPPLAPGIVAVSFADYDGNRTVDVFVINGSGQNSLLLNNGIGKLSDTTETNLPPMKDLSLHADWADFDLDGDNDLLVGTRHIPEKDRAFPSESSYFLENNGQGYFTKKTSKVFPPFPVRGVFLLDADGSDFPDVLLETGRGLHYMRGGEDWRFSLQTKKRLPGLINLHGLTFADIDGDSYLDVFAISRNGTGHLWQNGFN